MPTTTAATRDNDMTGDQRSEIAGPLEYYYYCTDCESRLTGLHNGRCGCGSGRVMHMVRPRTMTATEADAPSRDPSLATPEQGAR